MRRLFPLLVLLVGAALAARVLFSTTQDNKDDPKLFANRIWTDRSPKDDRDLVLYFVPIEIGSKRSGVVQRASRYAFGGEVFRWSRDKSQLTLELPQQNRKTKLSLRTWSCSNEAPKGFDLCLELSDGQHKQRLYSRKGWRMPKGEDVPVSIAEPPDLSDALPVGCPDCEWTPFVGDLGRLMCAPQ